MDKNDKHATAQGCKTQNKHQQIHSRMVNESVPMLRPNSALLKSEGTANSSRRFGTSQSPTKYIVETSNKSFNSCIETLSQHDSARSPLVSFVPPPAVGKAHAFQNDGKCQAKPDNQFASICVGSWVWQACCGRCVDGVSNIQQPDPDHFLGAIPWPAGSSRHPAGRCGDH